MTLYELRNFRMSNLHLQKYKMFSSLFLFFLNNHFHYFIALVIEINLLSFL